METHSLFSLEIVVEKLYLPNTSCRFPTIACKLLDFPVITIDLVEKSMADTIRKKYKSKPERTIPDQFENLKDFEDTFRFSHGKSCLFKICPETLKSLLLNVPLYVMVLDTMPNPPKLTGNASVPLDKAIKKICRDLSKNGPDVPVIHKDTGLLRIYNLMAKEIGYMTFGYRLLYLGSTLLPHLSVAESKVEATESEKLTPNVIIRDIEKTATPPRPMPRHRPNPPKEIENLKNNSHTELLTKTISKEEETIPQIIITDRDANVSIPEPVLTKEDNPKDLKIAILTDKSDDQISSPNCLLLNDMEAQPEQKDPFQLYCPPPIFYRKSNSKLLSSVPDVSNNNRCDVAEKTQQPGEQLPFIDEIQQTENSYNSAKVLKMEESETPQNKAKTKTFDTLLATELNKYPYLSGILKELSSIDVPFVIQQILDNLKEQNLKKVSASEKSPEIGKSGRSKSAPAKRKQGSASVREKQIPQNKSWIRCTQQLSGRKSSLQFGVTKTHILRMNKLQSLEEEDIVRGKLCKAEKESTFKVKKSRKIPQEPRNEVNVLKKMNVVNVVEERSEVNAEKEMNEVNVEKEMNKVKVEEMNKINVEKEMNKVNVMERSNEVNIMKGRSEAEEKEAKLSGEQKKSLTKMEELPMKDTSKIQNVSEESERVVIKNESKDESEPEQIQKQSSISTDISEKDKPPLEIENQSDKSIKVSVYSDEESARSFKSENEKDNVKFNNSDENKSDKDNKENQKGNSIDLGESHREESIPMTKTYSVLNDKTVKDDNQKVEKTQKVSISQNLSSLVPLSATSPQLRPRFSRGPSLQESNASTSTIFSETPVPTPRTRRLPFLMKKDSIHTDSVSSYRPSEDNDELFSYSSSKQSKSPPPEDYSDDFLTSESEEEDDESELENEQKPKIIPENKLGYTIW